MVTGAASGLGRAVALRLAVAGAVVACVDRDGAGAEKTASAVAEQGGSATAHTVDVGDRAAMVATADEVAVRHGRIDILVSSAGIILDVRLLDVEESELEAVLAVNTKGVLFGCQAVAPHMESVGGGAIVTMSSTAIDFAVAGNGLYAMSKVAAAQLSRTLATELGPSGIRVNTVAPGFVETPMTERNFRGADGVIDEARRNQVLGAHRSGTPLGQLCEPEDIADAVLYLVSDQARRVTGQVLRVNGGISMPL
ncbi:beta-ketoacyl-ACP reductase [Pseudonocardia ailaonensis]|uniref:Beta-ketoacyl-ACP reductase n=1 Tax=Pseudonocardia ailaonensis TaxID=367279 RepID=A0ABN2N1F5_9PSEU